MAQVINPTSFPHALYRKLGPGDQEYDVVVVRATYRFTEDNWPLFESSHQQPIRWQPTLEGDSDNLYAQVITDDRDVLLGKLSTEVHVHGTLRSPTGQPRSTWQVRVQVGPVGKRLIVRGPREFRWQLLGGWRVTDPTPVSEVPLDYRYAFGGHYSLPDGDALANTLYYPDNPAGRGWLPSRADYKRVSSEVARYLKPDLNAVTRLPAPQLEDPDWLVTSPFDRPAPAGFGPIAPWWEPRVSYQGTFDDHWKTQRLPYWPEDFDYRFHHSAPADLVAPDYLRGDELMILTNCLPNSRAIMVGDRQRFRHRTRLPGIALQALTDHASGQRGNTPLALDSVVIDLDREDVSLTWRALFPLDDPLKQVRIRRTPLAALSSTGGVRHVG